MADETLDAMERARLLLEAQHLMLKEQKKEPHHPRDVPAYAIERAITDLMHYAHERNKGLVKGSGDYIDVPNILKSAQAQFIKEREAAPERNEPLLDSKRPQPDPKFEELQAKLYSRQLAERNELEKTQRDETARLGASRPLEQRHRQQLAALTEKFEKERERYAREYQDALKLRDHLRDNEKSRDFEKNLTR